MFIRMERNYMENISSSPSTQQKLRIILAFLQGKQKKLIKCSFEVKIKIQFQFQSLFILELLNDQAFF